MSANSQPLGQTTFARLAPWLLLAPAVILLVAFFIVPLFQFVSLAFIEDGSFDASPFQKLFGSTLYAKVFFVTFKLAAINTVVSLLISYPAAYYICALPPESRSGILVWVLVPFWTSFLVRTFAWVFLLGRSGLMNSMLIDAGLIDAPASILYTMQSTLIGMIHAMTPLCVLTLVASMSNIDRSLPRAAVTLGASPARAFWEVYFPLSLPGVGAAGLLVFVGSLGAFIMPTFLGSERETVISQVVMEQVLVLLNWRLASAIALILLCLTMLCFLIYDRLVGLTSLAGQGASDEKTQPKLRQSRVFELLGAASGMLASLIDRRAPYLRRITFLQKTFLLLVLGFLTAPVLVLVPVSFTDGGIASWPPQGFSLRWYEQFWSSPIWLQALWVSLQVGFSSAAMAMVIGLPVALFLTTSRSRLRSLVMGAVLTPMMIPGIVTAVSLFYFYANLGLVGQKLPLIISHSVLSLPYVVVTLVSVLKGYDRRYDAAAATLGASRLKVLRYVTFPIIKVGLLSAFLFAFILSFDEVTIALFVTGGLMTTLPKQMWDEATLSVSPTVAAVSTMLLVFMTLVILLTSKLSERNRKTA